VKDVECDEIWGFVGKKEGHKSPEEANDEGLGDAYCFVAIERNTKLVLNFALGRRNQATTDVFIEGLRHATGSNPYQITTDGFAPYKSAIVNTLEDRRFYGGGPSYRTTRSETHLHLDCRAPESHDPHVHAPLDAPDERVFQKMGKFVGRVLPALRLLQLLPGAQNVARDACDGVGLDRSHLGACRSAVLIYNLGK
jgi:IS1 family transposase